MLQYRAPKRVLRWPLQAVDRFQALGGAMLYSGGLEKAAPDSAEGLASREIENE